MKQQNSRRALSERGELSILSDASVPPTTITTIMTVMMHYRWFVPDVSENNRKGLSMLVLVQEI